MLGKLKNVLLEHGSLRQVVFKNSFWIGVSEGFNKAVRAILLIYLARILGAVEYGKFSFALSFVSIFVSFLDLGLSSIVTREFSRKHAGRKEFSALFTLKIVLGCCAFLAVFVSSFFITHNPAIRRTIWILAVFSFVTQLPELIYAVWRAQQRMEYEAWSNMFIVVTMVASVFFIIFTVPSMEAISLAYLLSSVFCIALLTGVFNARFLPVRLDFSASVWLRFLSMSWPLALTSIAGMFYGYLDSIIMGYLKQMAQTGWYNAALKVVYLLSGPASIITLNFFPVLSRFSNESRERFQHAWNYQMGIMLSLAVPIVAGGVFFAEKIILFFYGREYYPSVFVLQILIFMSGASFLCCPFSNALVAANQQKNIFFISLAGAATNIALNLLLIPRFSLYGAAFASVISYLVMLYAYARATSLCTTLKPFNRHIFLFVAAAVTASLVMLALGLLPPVYKLNLVATVLIAAGGYLAAYFGCVRAVYRLTGTRII